jgi:hypothetical protein
MVLYILKKECYMNISKNLLLLIASSTIALSSVAQESTRQSKSQLKNKRVPAAILFSVINDSKEIENLLVTTYNSLPPAEQQQIVTTLLNIFMTILQSSPATPAQTTTTQPNTTTPTNNNIPATTNTQTIPVQQ